MYHIYCIYYNRWGNTDQNHNELSPYTNEDAYEQNKDDNYWEGMEKGALLHIAGRNVNECNHYRKHLKVPWETKNG